MGENENGVKSIVNTSTENAVVNLFGFESTGEPPLEYDRLVSDVWVGVVLILMILACVGCVCSCLLYYKFKQWKMHVGPADSETESDDAQRRSSKESLPSYTFVTGLPTYEQAVEIERGAKLVNSSFVYNLPPPPPPPPRPPSPPPLPLSKSSGLLSDSNVKS